MNKVQELIEKKALVPLLIKILGFMSTLKDSYCFEYEINNHNILIRDEES